MTRNFDLFLDVLQDKQNSDDCWVFSVHSILLDDGSNLSLSRYVYEKYIGKLPYRTRIDRTCQLPSCLNHSHMLPSSPVDKFWRKVNKGDKCWEWTGAKDGGGYGTFKSPTIPETKSHRIAWYLENGNIPKGIDVLHKCDNPPCIRIDHLFLGTDIDNVRDKQSKHRESRLYGNRNGMCKLSKEQVMEIVSLHESGRSYRELSSLYGIGTTQVQRIARKQSWRWLWV